MATKKKNGIGIIVKKDNGYIITDINGTEHYSHHKSILEDMKINRSAKYLFIKKPNTNDVLKDLYYNNPILMMDSLTMSLKKYKAAPQTPAVKQRILELKRHLNNLKTMTKKAAPKKIASKKPTAKQLAARKAFAAMAKARSKKAASKKNNIKKATKMAKAKKATPKKKVVAKKVVKNVCAVSLGKKGGQTTKRKKVGIFAPTYKRKKTAKKKK